MANERMLTMTIAVQAGKLSPTPGQKETIAQFLAGLGDKPCQVRFSKPQQIRSLKQNRYYWSVVLPMIASHVGHTPEEIHYWFKEEFLPRKFITMGKKELEIRKTTTELSTGEFEEYLAQVRSWAAQNLALGIPLPNEA